MKTNIIKLFGFGLMSGLVFTSCSDDFLKDKQNYDYTGPEAYDDVVGAQLRVNDIYTRCLPDVNENLSWGNPSVGKNDDAGKSTEEYSGFGAFVDGEQNPLNTMSGTTPPDLFFGSANNIRENTYGHIRNINETIENIEAGSLTQEQKDELLGQCYFFRAWRYYNLVKYYGGVPIVETVLDPVPGITTPRSTAKECIDFILSDLDKAAKMLAATTMNGSGYTGDNWGRVTTGTAVALKGRVLLLWASPLFNRSNDQSRWTYAYQQMEEGLDSIEACGYHLYTDAGNVNGSAFAKMFNERGVNPEAVFVTLYNNRTGDGNGNPQQYNSSWERSVRPSNTSGSGLGASAMLIDMFPMKDGKRPSTTDTYTKLSTSTYTYEREYPFMNRDPRFYRTFAFPGFRWAYQGSNDLTADDPNNPSYDNGANYELWNYVWYQDAEGRDNPYVTDDNPAYGADNLLTNVKGVYVRKRSDDLDVNTPLYTFSIVNGASGFSYSAQPYMEIRFAEVLLNLAEAACGAGDTQRAIEILRQIRQRAGYTSADCGIDGGMDQAACMSAILYERQIEFAYEGKRFDDCRRWLLYDGGAHFNEVAGAPSTWTLTGWNGNTCTWLGVKPLNGQRRESLEFRVNDNHNNGLGGTTVDGDPIKDVARCAAVDLRKELDPQLETLKAWYGENLVRKDRKGDGHTQDYVDLYVDFKPYYYFLGIPRGAQSNMKAVEQTIGWEDYNNGGNNGTYDPLQ